MVNFMVEMMTKMVTNPDDDGCLIMIRNPPFKSQWIGEEGSQGGSHNGPGARVIRFDEKMLIEAIEIMLQFLG